MLRKGRSVRREIIGRFPLDVVPHKDGYRPQRHLMMMVKECMRPRSCLGPKVEGQGCPIPAPLQAIDQLLKRVNHKKREVDMREEIVKPSLGVPTSDYDPM